jgi:hypothetical protein
MKRLGRKNNPAYFASSSLAREKSFKTFPPVLLSDSMPDLKHCLSKGIIVHLSNVLIRPNFRQKSVQACVCAFNIKRKKNRK